MNRNGTRRLWNVEEHRRFSRGHRSRMRLAGDRSLRCYRGSSPMSVRLIVMQLFRRLFWASRSIWCLALPAR